MGKEEEEEEEEEVFSRMQCRDGEEIEIGEETFWLGDGTIVEGKRAGDEGAGDEGDNGDEGLIDNGEIVLGVMSGVVLGERMILKEPDGLVGLMGPLML